MDQASSRQTERSLYIGNALGCITYGVLLCITFASVYLLASDPTHDKVMKRRNQFLIGYSVILLVLMAFALSVNVLMGQLMWIEHRDFPGGPFSYMLSHASSWWEVLGSSTAIVANFMGDALLIYRCYIVWNSVWVALPLILLFLASIAFSILSIIQSALPNSSFYTQNTANFSVPWIALTCGLNALVTILIVARILWVGRRVNHALSSHSLRIYTGVASILIESALPFSVLGIVYGVYVGNGKPPQVALGIIWGTFFALSPQLIILRVAMGRAWSTKTSAMLTTPTIVNPNTGKDSQGKTTFNFEGSQGKSTTYESVGESKNTLVISGNSFTDMNVRA